jgi:hypothetical protein
MAAAPDSHAAEATEKESLITNKSQVWVRLHVTKFLFDISIEKVMSRSHETGCIG